MRELESLQILGLPYGTPWNKDMPMEAIVTLALVDSDANLYCTGGKCTISYLTLFGCLDLPSHMCCCPLCFLQAFYQVNVLQHITLHTDVLSSTPAFAIALLLSFPPD